MSLLLLLRSHHTRDTDDAVTTQTAEALARRLGYGPKAPHAVREVVVYYPETPDGQYLVLLNDPDTGPVDFVIDKDRASGWRRLDRPFAEDT